jgi:aspartyl-tRNA synthetase
MYKAQDCGSLSADHIGERVRLAGWVNRRRDHGGLTFIDLRDNSGVVQVVTNPERSADAHSTAESVRSEWVLQVEGSVRGRPAGMENPSLPTGEIEVEIESLVVLNPAKTPPFSINEEQEVDESVRLKYRYLDLRRERLHENLHLRHRVVKFIRDYLDARGFIEVETPILFKTTPEGARDYLVPSRVHPGEFYALPQSPQQLKQLLMIAGFERYFQIARCFRDEDQRGNRQPEFTQLDLELSFVDRREDIMDIIEPMYTEMVEKLVPQKRILTSPWPRLTYAESLARFGTDRPDMRFGLELVDVSETLRDVEFKVFRGALEAGGVVRGINAQGCGGYSRRELDELTETVKEFGAKGLAYIILEPDGSARSPIAKHLGDQKIAQLRDRLHGKPGDLLLFVADGASIADEAMSRLRLSLGDRLGLRDADTLAFCWVIDFPFAFWNEEEGRWDASQHPFTSPLAEDLHLIDRDPGSMRGTQYDVVLNGDEVSGGSIRIHDRELQERIFKLIGLDPEVARQRFGHMLDAFEYGAPPHGGIAAGLDRLIMILAGEPNIREVIAFPKNQAARDVMAGAPSPAEPGQLAELKLRLALDLGGSMDNAG